MANICVFEIIVFKKTTLIYKFAEPLWYVN